MQVFIENYIKKGTNIFGYETGPISIKSNGLDNTDSQVSLLCYQSM